VVEDSALVLSFAAATAGGQFAARSLIDTSRREFNKKTMTQMQAESGARADYRTVGGQLLLRELVLR